MVATSSALSGGVEFTFHVPPGVTVDGILLGLKNEGSEAGDSITLLERAADGTQATLYTDTTIGHTGGSYARRGAVNGVAHVDTQGSGTPTISTMKCYVVRYIWLYDATAGSPPQTCKVSGAWIGYKYPTGETLRNAT